MSVTSAASRTSGPSATTHPGSVRVEGEVSGIMTRLDGFEHAHPAKFSKLALVRVEHVATGIPEACLEYRALPLAQHQRVCALCPGRLGAGSIRIEEHSVQVKAVQQIELGHVDEIDADQRANCHAQRFVHEVMRDGVDRVNLVVGV